MSNELINIYCDESCHLPKDRSDVMVLGALSCPEQFKKDTYERIRQIKLQHGIDSRIELKWTKVSSYTVPLYNELIKYYFSQDHLAFRAIVIKNKRQLDHIKYNNNDHDLWYYKMHFLLLDRLCFPDFQYRIFIDAKDTRGGPRVRKLHEVLCNNKYDYKKDIIKDIQQIDSARSDLLQITDIFTGALSFYHRGLYSEDNSSPNKKKVVNNIKTYIGDTIDYGTGPMERKFNIFIWTPRR